MKSMITLPLLAAAVFSLKAQENYLVIGTYTKGTSEGVYVVRFNSTDGSFTQMGHAKTSNPSYMAISPDEKHVYTVLENASSNGKGGEIAAFSFDKKTGNLTYISQQPTGGDHPCYVSVDKTGKWVAAGNYSSGSLSILPVNADGGLAAATTHIQHEGAGKDPKRQEKPHVHCTLFSDDNKFLFVPDLGIDKVMVYSFDEKTGSIKAAATPFAASDPGSGPRHITFHPNQRFAYLVEELSGTVVAFRYHNGKLEKFQRLSSMPAGDSSAPSGADIHVSPDGKFLYASNRGKSNTIAIFSIDPKDGSLTLVGHQSTMGNIPRNFNFDPTARFLLVANQESDNVVIFKRDPDTGLLTDTGKRISVGKPVCLKWIAMK